MRKAHVALLVGTISCFFLAGCGAGTPQAPIIPTRTAAPAAVVAAVITAAMRDQTIRLKVGDTFEIQIPTIPTAGYVWQVQNLDAAILEQVGGPVFTPDASQNAGGGIVTMKFKVVGAGTGPLILIYANSPAGGAASLSSDSFGVTIEAR